jgi:hypothetical protein
MPPVAAGLIVGLAALSDGGTQAHAVATGLLTAGLEAVVPLAGAILTASMVGNDPARELLLSLPMSYRQILLRRILLASISPMLTALCFAHLLMAANRWVAPAGGAGGDLTWLAPLLWLTAWACALAIMLRSATVAVALVAVLTLAEGFLHDLFVGAIWLRPIFLFATTFSGAHQFWWANRFALLLTASLALVSMWLFLKRPERLLVEETA